MVVAGQQPAVAGRRGCGRRCRAGTGRVPGGSGFDHPPADNGNIEKRPLIPAPEPDTVRVAVDEGKSTIYRLLLGFKQPTSGSVFLDAHDLSGLDMAAAQQRMGVVLQNSHLVAGSNYESIAGMSPLSADDAWEAARAAALEKDIRAMPMGVGTVVPADGAGLSVGQKQRLLIARAFARRPRVVLFDEATSALDNRARRQSCRPA